jgi:serine/threonine protein kinase
MSIPNVIGEGAFGCVHKPSLTCSNKRISYKNKISKIMLSKEAMKELNEYALIAKIDKNKEYYLGMPIKCKLKNTAKAVKAINKCKHIKKKYFRRGTVKKNISNMSLLVMNDGGDNLKTISKIFYKMTNQPDTIHKIKQFWIETHRLFRGLISFQKYDIIHHDIKPQNIVYNLKTNRVNFIDFGHMRNMKEEIEKCERSDNWIYDSPFWNYPFEIQFLNKDEYMHFTKKSEKEREQFVLDFVKDLNSDNDTKFTNAFRIFMNYILRDKSKPEQKRWMDKYILDFKKTVIEQMDSYEEFIKKSIETMDVYGLGMSLQFILLHTKQFMEDEVVKEMEECFLNMTSADLQKRYSCFEAADAFESCLIHYIKNISFDNHEIIKRNES